MGRRDSLLNVGFFCGLPILAGIAGLFWILAAVAPLGLIAIACGLLAGGLTLFLVAKISLVPRGVWLSFGSARMSAPNRLAYRMGHVVLLTGMLAAAVVLRLALHRVP